MNAPSQELVVAYVAVGSNINPEDNILAALQGLKKQVNVRVTSRFYLTQPIERPDQDAFINGVWEITTNCEPRELKYDVLRVIEDELGRHRTEDTHAPRTIDLDLVLYGDRIIAETGLHIPDLDIYRRAFVAVPLLEIAPGLIIPGTGRRLSSVPVAKSKEGLEPLPSLTRRLKKELMQ
jgi:2-amino-4-hydroxy-6-hydroxymethyldihydropteridine diphosphokinase